MLFRILKKDLLRKKSISITLFIFVSLSAFLVSSGANMITELTNSLTSLFTKSSVPHFVQMHAGPLDEAEIDRFAAGNKLVEDHQTVEMIKIDGLNLTIGNVSMQENNSVMDHYFVQQNPSFDRLLNLDSQAIEVAQGEIAVPIYYKQRNGMEIGDVVQVASSDFRMAFKVVDFVRDAQMNPSIIHSKRFVVNELDLERLKANIGEAEYLIEFRLTDSSKLSEFRNAYQASTLPKLGPSIDFPLFQTLNALTDGIIAAVIILVSLLLSIIAMLCLRYTILAAMEEDYREIGVMKAIGIGQRDIKRIYLFKYIVLAALASVVGYVGSLFLGRMFTANILLYIGTAPKSILLHLIPFIAVAFIYMIVVFSCMLTLRRFNRISAVEALRSGNIGEARNNKRFWAVHRNRWFNIPIFLGIRDVLGRFKSYGLLLFVFLICSFLIIVPVNFFNTVKSPDFNTYMGIERSDLRVDLQQSNLIESDFGLVINYLNNDEDIERYSPMYVSQFKMVNSDGVLENLTVESGDFSEFPLDYLNGTAPIRDNEIALSYLNGKEMNKTVGDQVRLVVRGQEREMTVSGIYQDVTNGGRTAKAVLPFAPETVLRYEVSIDFKPGIDVSKKMEQYATDLHPAKVTDLEGYLGQTLGNTIDQLKLLTIAAIAVALLVSILITSLFLKMAVAKDNAQIAILRSIGFSLRQIRAQYVARALLILGIGIVLGTVLSNTMGQSMAGVLLSFMGASRIDFVIDPIQSYMLLPIAFMIVVTVTALISLISIKNMSVAKMNAE